MKSGGVIRYGVTFKIAWKRYLIWIGMLIIEIMLVLYLVFELKSMGSLDATPGQFLRMGLYVGSYAVPASAMGVYGILWLDDFSKRKVEQYLACGVERQNLYLGKSLFGLAWIILAGILTVSGLLIGGYIFGQGHISLKEFFVTGPILLLFIGILFLLNAFCSLVGVLLRKRKEGLLFFGILLFFWERWWVPFGEVRVYKIIFGQDWLSAGIMTGILMLLAIAFFITGKVLMEKLDVR